MDTRLIIVLERHQDRRLDVVISDEIADLSRQRVQSLLRESMVTVNEWTVTKASTGVRIGDRIVVHLPPPIPCNIMPEDLPLHILYEDEHIAVISKPPGQVVHPAGALRRGTLANALLYHFGSLSTIGGVTRPGIVHRLDKETSGVLIVAKNDFAHQGLSAQFRARQVDKVYWAFVYGVPKSQSGRVDLPIGRHFRDRKRFAVREEGKSSLTEWRQLACQGDVAWLEVRPHTGRTHQIRVHLRHQGYPILNDRLYGFKRGCLKGRWADISEDYSGIFLHSRRVGFTHPISGDMMTIQADPPDKFMKAVELIGGSQDHDREGHNAPIA
ncbi:MAG: RluA family pseudouridine synthase [bacterium]